MASSVILRISDELLEIKAKLRRTHCIVTREQVGHGYDDYESWQKKAVRIVDDPIRIFFHLKFDG